jgi:hypothetical protein
MIPTEGGLAMSTYTFDSILSASQRVNWRIEDVLPPTARLDFSKPFLPESLARTQGLAFLSRDERRTLNQIRGHGYLVMFGVVEEFILPFVIDHARTRLAGDDPRVRALLQFAGEEAKHIDLFKRFRAMFESSFGHHCEVIGPPEAIAKAVLAHDPLAVALTTLHIEWFTQRHYVDSVKDDQGLDPLFKSLLHNHWLEEAQHTKIDTLMIEALAAAAGADGVRRGVDGYLDIGAFLDGGLRQQAELDLATFERVARRNLGDDQRAAFLEEQLRGLRWTFLGSGMTHPNFLETLGRLDAGQRRRVEEVSKAFS